MVLGVPILKHLKVLAVRYLQPSQSVGLENVKANELYLSSIELNIIPL